MKNSNDMGEIAQKKNRGWCPLLVMMLGNALRVQCTFPNMETNKIGENHKHKGGWCSLLMMMFEVLFSGSSVHFQIQKVWLWVVRGSGDMGVCDVATKRGRLTRDDDDDDIIVVVVYIP